MLEFWNLQDTFFIGSYGIDISCFVLWIQSCTVEHPCKIWSHSSVSNTLSVKVCAISMVMKIDGSAQDCSNSIANALEWLQSCARPSIYIRQFILFAYITGLMMTLWWRFLPTSQWRHNERDGISNNRRLDCLLNRLFRRRSKKSSASLASVRPVTGGFPSRRASSAEMFPFMMTPSWMSTMSTQLSFTMCLWLA